MIEKVIGEIVATYLPYGGNDLDGFWYDTDWYFESSNAFNFPIEVIRTNKPESMLEISTSVSSNIDTLHSLNQAIDEIWRKLKFNYFEATSLTWYQEKGVFRFVTLPQEKGSYVTGKLIISGDNYLNLVERFEREQESQLPYAPGENTQT
jgi:hypothetical protein